MALNPVVRYPANVDAATVPYPYGKARNVTAPGDGTGTPYEKDIVNDLFGLQQALLASLAIAPTNIPDAVGASQYFQILAALSSGRANLYADTGVLNAHVLNPPAVVQAPAAFFDGWVLNFRPANSNTGATTVNVAGLGVRDIRANDDTVLVGGEILAGQLCTIVFNSGLNRWALFRPSKRFNMVVMDVSGNYAKPLGLRHAIVMTQGAGGGGGGADGSGASNKAAGRGGSGGGMRCGFFQASTLLALEPVVIGAGGVGGDANGGSGTAGGTTSFGAHISIPGGGGGAGDAAPSASIGRSASGGGNGSIGTGGIWGQPGGDGELGAYFTSTAFGGSGGSSFFGVGRAGQVENAGTSRIGNGFGAGGAGGATYASGAVGNVGGDGVQGVVVIWEFF